MNAIFTIVAKNYIGLAQVLEASVKAHSGSDFFIIVADDISENDVVFSRLAPNILSGRSCLGFSKDEWESMAFKYNLVEFCTAIKPACFSYLFRQKKYSHILYADPDVYFFSSPDFIFDDLNRASIVLTPHLLCMQAVFKGNYPDYLFLVNGTFNLGFIGLSRNEKVDAFLSWWHNRLINECFFDNDKGMATDQKWINLLPGFFSPGELLISRHKGLNVAPWNFHERALVEREGSFHVGVRDEEGATDPLVFIHFSGFDYRGFFRDEVVHKNESSVEYPDYSNVFQQYGKALQAGDFLTYADAIYSFNQFANGIGILGFNRRIYRRMLEEGMQVKDPFSTGSGSFYQMLAKKKLLNKASVSPDKMTNKNMSGFDRKLRYVNAFFILLKKIVGITYYSILMRFFKRYFSEENQAFLLDKKLGNKLR